MTSILLVRHAKSYANARNPAFGNIDSPLDDKGVEQAKVLGVVFKTMFAIDPPSYSQAVLASEYLRPRQTAEIAGFQHIETNPIINEAVFSPAQLSGRKIVEQHRRERWIPEPLAERAGRFVSLVRKGELEHSIYFTHGLFIAAVVSQLSREFEDSGEVSPYTFDPERGYIPPLATITSVVV
jgi:broad specificity phosphatase PhoE